MNNCTSCAAPIPMGANFCPRCGTVQAKEEKTKDSLIGQNLGTYRIVDLLGEGAMGRVYRAVQTTLGREVCVKTLLPHLATDQSLIQRFQREASTASALNHPNIVSVMDFGRSEQGSLYIVMELIDGHSLRTILSERSFLTLERALRITDQILSALEEAHGAGVIHRDLKPENVILARLRDGADLSKIVDFGIAKLMESSSGGTQLTGTGLAIGTPGYMAPEQIMGREVDARVDVYASGVLLYEMLTGRPLFFAENHQDLFQKHMTAFPDAPSKHAPMPLPDGLDAIVLRALHIQPDGRFDSALAFKRALEALGTAQRAAAATVANSGEATAAHPAAAANPTMEMSGAAGMETLRQLMPDKLVDHLVDLPSMLAGEKRHVAVVFVELLGLTSVTESISFDPDEAYDLKSRCFDAIGEAVKRYDGMVDKFIGDRAMILFGAPKAHEDDPERAVRCALEMFDALDEVGGALAKTLGLRVGIDAGEAVVGGVGGQRRLDYTVTGDVVANAERLLSHARAGSILVGRAIQEGTHRMVSYQSLPSLKMRGREETLEPFKVLLLSASMEGPIQLVGRGETLRAIEQLLAAAAAGGEGGRIVVGEAGVGKSRLLDEIEARAEQRGLEVMRASGGRMGGGEHLGLIRELVFSLCGGPPGKGTDVAQQLSSLSRRGLGRHQLGRLDHLLGIAAESNQFKGEENQQLDRAVFGQLFMESPDRKGVCLLLDDLHQADAGSLQILDSLLDVASGRSFAIFGSVRAGEGVLPRVRQLEVAPLDDEAMRALVDERLGGERKTAAVADRIVAHAEGNPLFAHETIRVLMDRGALRLTRGAWKLTADDGKLPVPNNLRLLVSARFDALSPDARTLLRHAAVAGRTFSLDLVTAAAADTVADARAAVDECQAAGMLLPWEKMPGGYRFTQAVAHEIVLAGLTGTMERHIHLCIAGALETGLTVVGKNPAEALAYHLLEAGETAKGLHYLTVAADLLASRYAFAEAAKHHTRALELSFQLAEEAGPVLAADAAEPILNLAARAGDSTAMVSPERAATLLGDVLEKVPAGVAEVERARVLRTRGNALVKLGRIREAEAGFSVALKCVAGHDEPELDAGLRADMASAHEANGDYMLASSRLLEGLQRLWGKPSGDPDLMWTFLNQLGRIHLKSGEHEKAREFFENARQQAQQSSRPVGEARILTNLASVYGMKGDTARAEALYGEALALSERTGDSIGIARIQYNQGRLIAGLGRRDDAIDCLQQSLAIANQVGWREGIAAATQMLDSLKPKGTGPR